ncbi:MAG: hypothetical protein JSW00_14195 [Thermoplasmata archaeon]|nr:MAG: hypothetical protein JSW00_14195 [Thermoplasmata archaeon]
MPYCPNCANPVTGRICQYCGYDVYRPPQIPQAQYGPPIGEIIGKSTVAKMGIALLIIGIIGLILAVGVPWIIAEREVGDYYEEIYECQECGYSEDSYFYRCPECESYDVDWDEVYVEGETASFSFNYDLDLVDGDEDDWGLDKFTTGEMEDYFEDTIGQAFIGLILTIVIAIILIIVGIMAFSGRHQTVIFQGLTVIVAAILLIPAVLMIVSGINLVGFNILEGHYNENQEKTGDEVTSSTIYPAGYLVLIFGLIILIFAFTIMIKELHNISSSQQTQSAPIQPRSPQYPGGDFYR